MDMMTVVAAVLASFAIGWLWYSPMFFGKMFMKESGISEAEMKKGMGKGKGMSSGIAIELLGTIIMVYVIGYFLTLLKVVDVSNAVMLAFWLWLGFKVPGVMSRVAWEKKSWNLLIVDGGHSLASMVVSSVILTIWR